MGKDDYDVRKALDDARKMVSGMELCGKADVLDAYMEVVCGDVLLAEQNLRNHEKEWEIASLVREFLRYARRLEGYDHLLGRLQWAASRLADTLYGHPRLKVELLELCLILMHRIEARSEHESDSSEELELEISFLGKNIAYADRGELDRISNGDSLLKHDPVEWTARWEEIIDDADRKVEERLSGCQRGMGYCHALWHMRMQVLEDDYGMVWRSPAVMNPGVMFD